MFQTSVGASIITIPLKSLYHCKHTNLKYIITCTENTRAKNRHKTLGYRTPHGDLVRYKPFTHTDISGRFKCLCSRLSLGVCWWKWLTSSLQLLFSKVDLEQMMCMTVFLILTRLLFLFGLFHRGYGSACWYLAAASFNVLVRPSSYLHFSQPEQFKGIFRC